MLPAGRRWKSAINSVPKMMLVSCCSLNQSSVTETEWPREERDQARESRISSKAWWMVKPGWVTMVRLYLAILTLLNGVVDVVTEFVVGHRLDGSAGRSITIYDTIDRIVPGYGVVFQGRTSLIFQTSAYLPRDRVQAKGLSYRIIKMMEHLQSPLLG